MKKILLIPDEEHQTHRITDASIELYHSDYNSQYKFIPRSEWEYVKDESGVITITLDQVITSRYLKLNVLFDERDKEFTPVDRAEFMNTLAAMLEVYHEAISWTEEYEYDSCGNRTLHRVTLVQADLYESAYYENSNRIKTNGIYAYTYDEAGNLVEKGNRFEIDGDEVVFTETDGEGVEYWEYTYDLLNRLTYVKKNSYIVSEYGYDPHGYRVVKRAGGQIIHYVFEGTEPVFEKNVMKGEIKSYVYALGKHLARVDGGIGDNEASVWFIHTDHLGSVRAVSNSEGEVVWSTDYKPFGELFGQQDTGFEEWHGFTGKEWDDETGLYYYNARWYDSGTGRFISEDPVKDGINWYVYCGNNPLLYIDLSGLKDIIYTSPTECRVENDWGFFDFLNDDKYFVEENGYVSPVESVEAAQMYFITSRLIDAGVIKITPDMFERLPWNMSAAGWFLYKQRFPGAFIFEDGTVNSGDYQPYDLTLFKIVLGGLHLLKEGAWEIVDEPVEDITEPLLDSFESAFDEELKPLDENFDFGSYLRKITGEGPPEGMIRAHSHHIVFKGEFSNSPIMKHILTQSRKILEKYEIDPIFGVENLMWAPNTAHSIENAIKVLNYLYDADIIGGTRESVVEALREAGREIFLRK